MGPEVLCQVTGRWETAEQVWGADGEEKQLILDVLSFCDVCARPRQGHRTGTGVRFRPEVRMEAPTRVIGRRASLKTPRSKARARRKQESRRSCEPTGRRGRRKALEVGCLRKCPEQN